MYNGNDYYTVFRWFKDELGLSKSEIPIYAVIYGYSRNGENTYNSTANYLAEITGTSRSTVMRTLEKLEEKNLIKKIDSIVNGQKRPEYKVINVEEKRKEGRKEKTEDIYEFNLLSKDELKEIYINLEKYQKEETQKKIDFIISLYNLKYKNYKQCKKLNKNDYDKLVKILKENTLRDIIKKIVSHLENKKTEKYKNICQIEFIINNYKNIIVKKGILLGRLYFEEDFQEIEENFFY